MEHPNWSCNRWSDHLKREGVNVSAPTFQRILIKHVMGSRQERLLKLEEKTLDQDIELSPQQMALMEKPSPNHKECHVENSRARCICGDRCSSRKVRAFSTSVDALPGLELRG